MAFHSCHHITQHAVLGKQFSRNIAATQREKLVLRTLSQSKEELSKTVSAYVLIAPILSFQIEDNPRYIQ